MLSKWFIIINPGAGNWTVEKEWNKIEKELKKQEISFDYEFIKRKGHSLEIVKKAMDRGYRKFICVGGDGSIHFAINAILKSGIEDISSIKFAIIPMGTGNDLVKTYGIPKDIKKNIEIIKQEKTTLHDIGKLNIGNEIIYFSNATGIGFDGYVTNKVHKYKDFGASAYLIGAFMGLLSYKRIKMRIEFDNEIIEDKILMLLMGIGKYIGGGMQLTQKVNTNDGLFDISFAKKFGLLDLLRNSKTIFKGGLTENNLVYTHKTDKVKITLLDTSKKCYLQADGETFEVKDTVVATLYKQVQFVVP
ncbi:MAG: diacylglycerol kinase family lipid kinase [Flavobacteriaceae bacterium]|nr:diacylglycerol kinase family lipid kinase [Flavobacteriaceae bacterium]